MPTLREAVFWECALGGAVFQNTQLAGADFTTATGFTIDPVSNPLKGARFTLDGLRGVVAGFGLVVE